MKLKKLLVASAASLGCVLGGVSVTQANPVDVEVVIDFPSIAILDYYQQVDVEIDVAALAAILQPLNACAEAPAGGTLDVDVITCNQGDSVSVTATEAGGDLTAAVADVDVADTADDLTATELTLENVWAIRGIHNNDIRVAAAAGAGNTLSNGASQIVVSVPGVDNQTDTAAPGLAAGDAVFGDVVLNLDMTGVTTPGSHANAGQPTYTLEVTLL